ncbi:MAG TPA: hypothetical protein VGG20_00115 [Thermoanaerobaculia bacterium]|jgi:hypothetical protein
MAVNRSDLDALTGKLRDFAKGLPDQEQNILQWILVRAKASESELLDDDLDAAAGGKLQVTWSRGTPE